jgi:hypothetical protein
MLEPTDGLSRERPKRVRDYVEVHLDDDLSLTLLAGVVCLSPYHFSRSFKQATGVGPRSYVIQRRLEDLGAYELKGFAEPVPAWRVLSARDVESRFAATRTGSSAPLVGRQEEMGLLLRAWDGSRHGRGQVVLIQGEAGLGKFRLVEGLREAAGKDHIWVAIRCSPFTRRALSIRSGKHRSSVRACVSGFLPDLAVPR